MIYIFLSILYYPVALFRLLVHPSASPCEEGGEGSVSDAEGPAHTFREHNLQNVSPSPFRV